MKQSVSDGPFTDSVREAALQQNTLLVAGEVKTALLLTAEELHTMKTEEVNDVLVACRSGDPKCRIAKAKGVLLEDVLNMAGIKEADHNAPNRMCIVVTAHDNYRVVFSWHEIFNTRIGDGVLVLLERNGQPIDVEQGPFVLISAMDYLTGGRYVKKLKSIEVVSL